MARKLDHLAEIMGWRVPDDDDARADLGYASEEDTPNAEIHEFPVRNKEAKMSRPFSSGRADLTRIVSMQPVVYEDSRQVGEVLREGNPVIVNLGKATEAEARRILDFLLGVSLGLDGNKEKIADRVFLFSPKNVQVESELGASDNSYF